MPIQSAMNNTQHKRKPAAGTLPIASSSALTSDPPEDATASAGPMKKSATAPILTTASNAPYSSKGLRIGKSSPCKSQKARFRNKVAVISETAFQSTGAVGSSGSPSDQRSLSTSDSTPAKLDQFLDRGRAAYSTIDCITAFSKSRSNWRSGLSV